MARTRTRAARALGAILGTAILVAAAATARAATKDAADDWPGWRGPQRDGRSPDTGLLKEWPAGGPALLWKAEGIGQGFSSPAIAGGTVYVSGDEGDRLSLSALDKDGKVKWKADVAPKYKGQWPGARSTPTVDGRRLFLVSGEGVLACLEAESGRRLWTRDFRDMGGKMPQWGYAESALVLGDHLVVTPGGRNAIVALEKATGETVWASDAQAQAHYGSCIAIKGKKTAILAAGTGDGLFFVDARTGRKLWSNPWSQRNTANCPSPVAADGYVFWANGYGKGGICVKTTEKANGTWAFEEAWTTRDMDCHHGGYIVEKGFLYGNHKNGLACIDLKTGQTKWTDRGVGKRSLCFADGLLFLFSEKDGLGGLAAASTEGLKLAGTFTVSGTGPSWAHPVVIGGRLYLRYDTTLYCFDVKAKG